MRFFLVYVCENEWNKEASLLIFRVLCGGVAFWDFGKKLAIFIQLIDLMLS